VQADELDALDGLDEPEESESGERSERRRRFTATQLVIVFAITCALWLGLDFSRRVASAQRIEGQAQQLNQDLQRELARQATLEAQLAYSQSDAYVEDWARSEQKMVRPGERLVVPVIPTPAAPPPVAAAPPPAAPAPWLVWWSLLTGNVGALAAPGGP
jgi:cell division protein FtsB